MTDAVELPGVHRAPNIHDAPEIYEIENRAIDPDGVLRRTLYEIAPWRDRVVVDLGCGTGYHLPMFAATAAHVVGVEPHAATRVRALRRVAALGLPNVSIVAGSAEQTMLAAHSVDVVHSMFAYFFGPGSEPGIREVDRILRPGGTHLVVENDWVTGPFARWLGWASWPEGFDPAAIPPFWAAQGYAATPVETRWAFESRADLEAVIGIEFAPDVVRRILAEQRGNDVEMHYVVYHQRSGDQTL